MCRRAPVTRVAPHGPERDVIDRPGWASSHVTRHRRPDRRAAHSRRDASMGEKVVAGRTGLSDRQLYRDKLRRCLTGLERLLAEKRFDRPKNLMGLEIELNLTGADG